MRRTVSALALVLALALVAAACGDDTKTTTASGDDGRGQTITLVTHASFVVTDSVLKQFEDETGITVKVAKGDDAGAVVNQAILSKDNPTGDVLYGIDNTLLGRGLANGLFEPYQSAAAGEVAAQFELDPAQHRVTPIDYSDVCVNTDKRAFGGPGQPPAPTTMAQLAEPEYAKRLVVENPATSSTGLAFLLATVARYGESGWADYWKQLQANGVTVVDGWDQAYNDRFTLGGAGSGDKPLVVSYATSPPADIVYAATPKTTTDVGTVTDGCYRQIELAGILAGTKHRRAAEKLIDFLAGPAFQADMPLNMFVYPVRNGTVLPKTFSDFAASVPDPLLLAPATVDAKRDEWIKEWTSIVLR